MPKYIFSNGTIRTTTGLSKQQRIKRKQELPTVIIVFPNPVANQSVQEKEGVRDDEPRPAPKE